MKEIKKQLEDVHKMCDSVLFNTTSNSEFMTFTLLRKKILHILDLINQAQEKQNE